MSLDGKRTPSRVMRIFVLLSILLTLLISFCGVHWVFRNAYHLVEIAVDIPVGHKIREPAVDSKGGRKLCCLPSANGVSQKRSVQCEEEDLLPPFGSGLSHKHASYVRSLYPRLIHNYG